MSGHRKSAVSREVLRSVFLVWAAYACQSGFACGFHDPTTMLRGAMNCVYPDSLHVGTAVGMAHRAAFQGNVYVATQP